MAEIKFMANIKGAAATADSNLLNHTGSNGEEKQGLGFYGLAHGLSVPVGSVQDTTFVTNETGTAVGSQLNNTAMSSLGDGSTVGEVKVNNSAAIDLNKLPNYLCPLNLRFTNDDAVRVQECKLRVFNKSDIDTPAQGVTTYVFEARHPSNLQTVGNLNHRGRSDNSWVEFSSSTANNAGQVVDMVMTPSPGASGVNTDNQDSDTALGYSTTEGVTHASTQHDWYVALSAEPESIGSKENYALYFTLEYLS